MASFLLLLSLFFLLLLAPFLLLLLLHGSAQARENDPSFWVLRASARADLATQSDAIVNGSMYHGEIAKANPKNTPATPFSPKKPANMVLEKNMVFFFSFKLILFMPWFCRRFF
jgi:hypothetical protein